MNIRGKKQSQFELFPGASENHPQKGMPASLTKDLTLSLENIIVLCIVAVMALVFFFSCGVEKGKKVAALPKSEVKDRSVQVKKKEAVETPSEHAFQQKSEEQVVYPVEVPREVIDESQPTFQPPLEKNDEQENLFTIQVASFKLEKNAQKEADLLRGNGHDDAFVLPKGSYSIVCVGKFIQRNEAMKISNKLKKKYNDCMLRRL